MATRIELIGGPKHGEFIDVELGDLFVIPSVSQHVCDPTKMPCPEYVTYLFSPDRSKAFYYSGDGHDKLHPRQETE